MTGGLVRIEVRADLAGADAVGGEIEQIGRVLATAGIDQGLDNAGQRLQRVDAANTVVILERELHALLAGRHRLDSAEQPRLPEPGFDHGADGAALD